MKGFFCCTFFLIIVASILNGQHIKGVITDEFGNPLPAVNVFLKNTTTGSTSGADGRFRVEVKQGTHTIVFSILGYEVVEQSVTITGSKSVDLNIIMHEKFVDLNEAVVYADRRDIALKVMRGARERRKYYQDALKSYTCIVYRKTSLEREYIPPVLPDTIYDEENTEIIDIIQPDSVIQIKTTVLREYLSRIEASGILFRETILGENEHQVIRPSNSTSISFGIERKGLNIASLGRQYRDPYIIFHDASSARFDFLKPSISVPTLCEKPLLSPLAPTAPLFYQFDFDGVQYENKRKIFKIRVTPLFPGDALFAGHIFIEDSSWALKRVDLSVNPRVLLFCSEFRIKQEYYQINDSVLVTEKTEFYYTIKDRKDRISGKTGLYYRQFEVNSGFPAGFFSGQSVVFDTQALDRDSIWWISNRFVPLSNHEMHFALTNDSLQRKYESREYNDSLDSAYNHINVWSFLIFGIGIRSSIKKSELYILPLIAQINPVGIGGYRHMLGADYSKRFSNDMLLETEGMIDYGFLNKDIRGKVGTGLTYVPQKFVRTFIRFGDYYDMINDYASIGSVFSRSNYVRTQTLSIAQRMEIVNGVFGEITFSYSDQTPLRDMKLENWSNQLFGELNNPADFKRYKKFDVRLEMKFRPGQKYVMKGNRKIILETNKPEFSLIYRKGIPGLFGSEVNFDFLEFGVSDEMKIARWGTSNWRVLAGSFVNRRSLRLIEHRYFRGSDLYFFSDPIRSFQLLGATLSSSSAYFRANYMHHFEGALTNKIPVINRLKISLAGGAGMLMMEENNFRHAEMFAGIERVFRIKKQLFRVGIFGVTADDNLSKARITYKVGINMYNPYNGKWDY